MIKPIRGDDVARERIPNCRIGGRGQAGGGIHLSLSHAAGGGGIENGALVHEPAQSVGPYQGPEKFAQVPLLRGSGRDGFKGVRWCSV